MLEPIATIVLFVSLAVMVVIVWRKASALTELPEVREDLLGDFWLQMRNKIVGPSFFKNFSLTMFLRKIIYKIRILTMKAENKTSEWLKLLRQKDQNQKVFGGDNYWQELKNSKAEPGVQERQKPTKRKTRPM